MHEIKQMIQKIADDGDRQEMEELSDILNELAHILEKYDENIFKEYYMKLYCMAYGDRFNRKMAEEIISKMQPYRMRWSLEESQNIQRDFGLDNIDDLNFWIVLNSAYNDFRDIFGENLEMYARYVRDFIEDEDAKEGKVFRYFTTIVK